MEYLNLEITQWEQRLENGETPNFGDIQKLSKTGTIVYEVLEKNNLLGNSQEAESSEIETDGEQPSKGNL